MTWQLLQEMAKKRQVKKKKKQKAKPRCWFLLWGLQQLKVPKPGGCSLVQEGNIPSMLCAYSGQDGAAQHLLRVW